MPTPTIPVFKSLKLTATVGPFQETLVDAVDHSAGSADKGKLVVLNASGQIDLSMGGGGGGGITIEISGGSTGVTSTLNFLPGSNIGITNPGAGADIQIAFTGSLSFLPLAGGTLTGGLGFTDNTLDIGAVATVRPRTGYFGTSVLAPLFNAGTGFQIGGAAATVGHVLRANGTNYVDAQLAFADLGSTPTTLSGYGITDALPLAGGTLTGNLLFSADNAHNIGAAGATRPAHIYVGTDVTVPSLILTGTKNTTLTSGATGVDWTLTLPTSAGTNLYVLQTDGSGNTAWVAQTASGVGVFLPLAGGTLTGGLGFTDNTLDIGNVATLRPRTIFVGTSIFTPAIQISGLTASELVASDGSKNLVSVTALPNGTTATTQTALSNDTKVATDAYVDSAVSAVVVSGSLSPGLTVTTTNDSYTAAQRRTYSLTMAKTFSAWKVTEATGKKFRLQLYQTSAARTADASRGFTVPLALGTQHGCLLDLYINQNQAVTPFILSPTILGSNNDGTQATTIYAVVTSVESTTQNISVTISFVPLES